MGGGLAVNERMVFLVSFMFGPRLAIVFCLMAGHGLQVSTGVFIFFFLSLLRLIVFFGESG